MLTNFQNPRKIYLPFPILIKAILSDKNSWRFLENCYLEFYGNAERTKITFWSTPNADADSRDKIPGNCKKDHRYLKRNLQKSRKNQDLLLWLWGSWAQIYELKFRKNPGNKKIILTTILKLLDQTYPCKILPSRGKISKSMFWD